MDEGDEIGPLQLMVVGFEDPHFSGEILQELKNLSDQEMIKVVDAVVVNKDAHGDVEVLEISGLKEGEAKKYGSYIGMLVGIGTGEEMVAEELAEYEALRFQDRYDYGLNQDDLAEIANRIPEGGAALTILLEHIWAVPLRNAMRKSGGFLLAQDFLSPQLLIAIGAQAQKGITGTEKAKSEKVMA